MAELLHAFGINLKALLFQGINFAIVLVVLTWFVYRPLAKLVAERRKRIEFGLQSAEEADRRMAKIEEERVAKLKAADEQAFALMTETEASGKKRFSEIVHGATEKADYMLKEAALVMKRREQEEMDRVMKEAQGLIKEALVKTVELNPKDVDEKLISKALHEIHA